LHKATSSSERDEEKSLFYFFGMKINFMTIIGLVGDGEEKTILKIPHCSLPSARRTKRHFIYIICFIEITDGFHFGCVCVCIS
jgi:hypothetical protein